jgi:hypothetical protein
MTYFDSRYVVISLFLIWFDLSEEKSLDSNSNQPTSKTQNSGGNETLTPSGLATEDCLQQVGSMIRQTLNG